MAIRKPQYEVTIRKVGLFGGIISAKAKGRTIALATRRANEKCRKQITPGETISRSAQ